MGSSAFLLPIEPRGLYREMMTAAWRRGARLPTSHEAIRRAIGCTLEEWDRCWPVIAEYWHEADGSLVNDTQLEVYAEAVKQANAAHDRAVLGGQARAAQARARAQLEQVPQRSSGRR